MLCIRHLTASALIIFSILLFSLLLPLTLAAEPACLQAANRVKACPHKLYRAAQLPDMPKTAILCICVTDFQPLLQPASSGAERLQQHRYRQQLQAELGRDIEPILQILRRER